jgi:tRNA-Thr(GGU) m(6)t(6)A37 methyltransferase TsaA
MHNEQLESRVALPPMTAIGVIHTTFLHANGAPIQAATAGGAQGTVEIFPEFAEGLKDVAGFERLWLIFLLDRASAPQLIVRPYLDTQEHGIFSTRAPARPNPIGLSAVRLLSMEGNHLVVADVDMLDGTPLLDIKPYVPAFDSFAATRIGWYEGKIARGVVADNRFETRQHDIHRD